MKILVIGRYYKEGFASYVAEELERLGHSAVRYDPAPLPVDFGSRSRFYLNRLADNGRQLVKAIGRSTGLGGGGRALRRALDRAGAIDLVLSLHDYLAPADARLVKEQTRAPLVLWYPDPIWSFQRHMFLNAPYDRLFFKDPYLVDMLRRKLGVRTHYLPECYSPTALGPPQALPVEEAGYTAEICTAGNVYPYRVALFRNLADYDVKIWGLPAPLWLELGDVRPMVQSRYVAHLEKAKAFRSARIVLNNLNPAEIWGTNVRTFEICGAGGFQLVDWRPGLSQLFELGREVVAFDDLADLRAKIAHFLAAPEERHAIAAAGQRRALRDHTYAHRLTLLLRTVAGQADGYPEPSISWGRNDAPALA